MNNLKKLVIYLLIAVILLPATVLGYGYHKLNSMYVPVNEIKENKKNKIEKNNYKSVDGITNILLIGIDARNLNEKSRSDSMMILTVDNIHKDIKLTSLFRDTVVNIPGYGKEKLNHSYAYGGAELLLKTIEKNLNIGIDHHVTVDFYSFMDIVDVLGGVEVDIKESEVDELNKYINECYNFYETKDKDDMMLIKTSGVQVLNNYQTLAYSRIRYNDSAYKRDERQRKVMQSLYTKLSDLSIPQYISLASNVSNYVQTNIKPKQILNLAYTVYKVGNLDIKQLEFPIYRDNIRDSSLGWIVEWNKDKNLKELNDYIYEE